MSPRKQDGAGYINRHAKKANSPPTDEPWCWITLELMESAAWRAMSLAACRALFRLQREHMAHAGRENGRLKVTWEDFQAAGVPRRAVSETIAELETLGLARRTFRGRRSHGVDNGAATQFRLTWLPVITPDDLVPATNDWKRYGDDVGEARRVAKAAGRRTAATRDRRSLAKVGAAAGRQDIDSSYNGGGRETAVLVSTGEVGAVSTGEVGTSINGGGRGKTFRGAEPDTEAPFELDADDNLAEKPADGPQPIPAPWVARNGAEVILAPPLRALDLFCGAGGATRGLQLARFHVTGVDIENQPRYCGEQFIKADATAPPVDLSEFNFIWASPPCQAHTAMKTMHNAKEHADLIPQTRALLKASGRPYAIENVEGAPLIDPFTLCGTMFGLGAEGAELRRHRIFETNFPVLAPCCEHGTRPVIGIYGGHVRNRRRRAQGSSRGVADFSIEHGEAALQIDWMTLGELSQSIPPAYSEFIARQYLRQRADHDRAAA